MKPIGLGGWSLTVREGFRETSEDEVGYPEKLCWRARVRAGWSRANARFQVTSQDQLSFPAASSHGYWSSAGARDLGLSMGREECEQAFAHQHARAIRRHVHLDLAIHVDDRVRVGRFQSPGPGLRSVIDFLTI